MNYDAWIPAIRDRAIELLNKRGWTQDTLCRDHRGQVATSLNSDGFSSDIGLMNFEDLTCFCLSGAVAWATHEKGLDPLSPYLEEFYRCWLDSNPQHSTMRGYRNYIDAWSSFNDYRTTTREEVIDSLNRMEL